MADPLRIHVQPELTDASLVLAFDGWNDAGESATGAAQFLSESLATAPLAEIDPEEYYDFTVRRPVVRLDEGTMRRIEWPSFDFRFGSIPERCEVVIGVGGEPHLRWRSFCQQVIRIARAVDVKRVVLLGAFLADVLYTRPVRVTGFASSPELMGKLAIEPTAYEGPTGIVGVLADLLKCEGFEVVSLWAGLPHYISVSPNPRGSLALVQAVSELLHFPVDRSPLETEAAEFEQQISKLVSSDPALADYVKELKRREFAQ